jgi:hypothetical protein
VTETDPANERPSVQEDSQSKECDANHDPESTVACAKIRIAKPINAATIQSALIEGYQHAPCRSEASIDHHK